MLLKNPYFYATLSILFWSTAATAFKLTLKTVPFMFLLLCSSTVSFLIFFSTQKGTFQKKGMLNSALMGFLNPFLYYLVLFKAYSLLSAQEAMALNYTWPLSLVLLSYPLLGQKPSAKTLLGMGVSFIGVLFVAKIWESPWEGRPTEFLGMALAIGSSLIWALYWILNVKDKRDDSIKMAQNFFFGSLYSALFVATFSNFYWPEIQGGLGILYIGFFEMGFTFLFWLKALKYSDNTATVGRLIFIAPFFSLIWISMITGEVIQLSSVIGLILIVLGILGPELFERSVHGK